MINQQERKSSFFEKNDQKAFTPSLASKIYAVASNMQACKTKVGRRAGKETKAFWSFSSKKNYFLPTSKTQPQGGLV